MIDMGFDRYRESVAEADATIMLSGRDVLRWDVTRVPLGRTTLQYGCAGGATVLSGHVRPDASLFVLQKTEFSANQIFNGQTVDLYDIAVLPPGSRFTLVTAGPQQWLSISVFSSLRHKIDWASKELLFPATPRHICSTKAAVCELKSVANEQMQMMGQKRSVAEGEKAVLSALIRALKANEFRAPARKADRTNVILDMFGSTKKVSHLDDISRRVGVNERTLRRLFNDHFGMAPHRYLKLRQLNLVRRALRTSPKQVSITSILAAQGVTEFGRFAGEYRALFGQTPSETERLP